LGADAHKAPDGGVTPEEFFGSQWPHLRIFYELESILGIEVQMDDCRTYQRSRGIYARSDKDADKAYTILNGWLFAVERQISYVTDRVIARLRPARDDMAGNCLVELHDEFTGPVVTLCSQMSGHEIVPRQTEFPPLVNAIPAEPLHRHRCWNWHCDVINEIAPALLNHAID